MVNETARWRTTVAHPKGDGSAQNPEPFERRARDAVPGVWHDATNEAIIRASIGSFFARTH